MMSDNENNPGGPLTTQPPQQSSGTRAVETIEDIASTLRDLFNRVPESVNKAVERALTVKDTTVIVRLSEESSDKIDSLVSAGIFKTDYETDEINETDEKYSGTDRARTSDKRISGIVRIIHVPEYFSSVS
jgi:hypothetical protein